MCTVQYMWLCDWLVYKYFGEMFGKPTYYIMIYHTKINILHTVQYVYAFVCAFFFLGYFYETRFKHICSSVSH